MSGEELKPSQADLIFEKLSSIEPEIESEGEEEGDDGSGHKSYTEKIEESPNLTDFQTASKVLFPDMGKGKEHLNVLQVAEVFPEKFNPYEMMLVKDLASNNDELSVPEAYVYVDTSLSIAFDRKGRFDELELAGATEEKTLKKEENKGFGLP